MTRETYRSWYYRMSKTERSYYNRIRHLKKTYRLTDQEAVLFVEMAQFSCELCGKKATGVDHDHMSGRVRGPLCNGCNTMVGWVENRGLDRIAAYLNTEMQPLSDGKKDSRLF